MLVASDEELIKKIVENECGDSLKELASRHVALFNKIFSKFEGALAARGLSRHDAFAEQNVLFYQAARSFDKKKKAKFSTYFANYIRWYFLNTINHTEKMNSAENCESVDHIQIEIPRDSSSFYLKLPELIKQFDDPRIKKIYQLRYLQRGKQKKWREIAAEIGLSKQTCSKLHKRGVEQLRAVIEEVDIFA